MDQSYAIQFIKEAEGLRLDAYPDPASGGAPWTIGYGNTTYEDGSAIQQGDTITRERAESLLSTLYTQKYLPKLEAITNWNIMTQSQQAALASFTWNNGPNWYTNTKFSKLANLLKNMQWDQVAQEFYGFLGGPSVQGRVKDIIKSRRVAEGFMWYGAKIKIYNQWYYNPDPANPTSSGDTSNIVVNVNAPPVDLPWAGGDPSGFMADVTCDVNDYRDLEEWMLQRVWRNGAQYNFRV
jgi:GH24 family phage-related lysozyme (muramidase)